MSQPFRLLMAAVLVASVILAFVARLALPNHDLLAPTHPLVFMCGLGANSCGYVRAALDEMLRPAEFGA